MYISHLILRGISYQGGFDGCKSRNFSHQPHLWWITFTCLHIKSDRRQVASQALFPQSHANREYARKPLLLALKIMV